MSELWLSRARLRRDASVAALARLLVPDAAARPAAAHRLVWSLFADGPDRRRDFLWREEAAGRFMTLSNRPPVNVGGLFDLDSQPFAPILAPGDRLGFTLRANPVVARAIAPGQRGKRHDVVMDVLRGIEPGQRTEARPDAVLTAGRETGEPTIFGVMDISGVLTIEDPVRFLAAQTAGFGRARAFGCGLMLIRRVQ
jgi:CRISPR system Cascade subunit CasE